MDTPYFKPGSTERITPAPEPELTAVECGATGRAFLVDADNNVVEELIVHCPDCGEEVPTIFQHIDGCPRDKPE